MHTQAEEMEVRKALKRTLDVWPGRAPDVGLYYDAVADLPAPAIHDGIRELVREWRFSQRPIPGDVRRHAIGRVNGHEATVTGEDGYLRDAAGRYVVMDEMATREAYRREFGYVPPGWTDEAIAERKARLAEYRRLAEAPGPSRLSALLASLKREAQMERKPEEAA